jgi:hypothetical protein
MARNIHRVGAAVVVGLAGAAASGAVLDLTGGGSGAINGALLQTTTQQPTGTGVIDPFLRLQHSNVEQGYNTSGSPLPFDDSAGIWTHDMRMSDLRGVSVGGVLYAAFLLDINESNGGSNSLLSLNSVQIYTSPIGNQTTTSVASLGVLRWDMDAGGDSTVNLDYSLNHGSGSGDLLLYVPAAAFAGASASDHVYFYCAFGNRFASDAGFEEWANFGTSPVLVPGPGALALAGLGGFLVLRRRR